MKRTEFLKQVAERKLLPAYLFLGDENFFKEELFKKALDSLIPPEEQQFNLVKFDASEVEAETFLTQLETGGLFAETRVVRLDGLEHGTAPLEEAILKGTERMADGVRLFVFCTKLDGRKKLHQAIQKQVPVVDCGKLSVAEIPGWIKQTALEVGLQLTPGQVKVVSERLGVELRRIRTELEKMATFAGSTGKVSDEELDDLIIAEPEPNIFGLIDAVAERNPRLGLPRLKDLLDAGEPELKILATLARQFRNVVAASEGRREGIGHREIASFFGINPYVAEKSYSQATRFTLSELYMVLHRLLQADYRIKSGQREPRLELELAVAEICTMRK